MGADLGTALADVPLRAHLAALLLAGVELLARGVRVLVLARGLGVRLTLRTSVAAQLAGDAAAAVTPSRAGSDPAKITVLRRDGVGVGRAGALLVGEMGAEAGVLLACAATLVLAPPGLRWVALGVAGYAVVVSALCVAALLLSGTPGAEAPQWWRWTRLGVARWHGLRRSVADFREHAAALRTLSAGSILSVVCATAAHIGARLAVLPTLVLPLLPAAAFASGGLLADLLLRPFFVLYATALLPPPGGGGGVEVTFVAALDEVVGPAAVAATLVWWRVYTFYLTAALGGLLFAAGPLRALVSEGADRAGRGPPAADTSSPGKMSRTSTTSAPGT